MFHTLTFLDVVRTANIKPSDFQNEISVAFSKNGPFLYQDQNRKLKGLDIAIMENFAQKNNLRIKYIEFDVLNLLKNELQSVYFI